MYAANSIVAMLHVAARVNPLTHTWPHTEANAPEPSVPVRRREFYQFRASRPEAWVQLNRLRSRSAYCLSDCLDIFVSPHGGTRHDADDADGLPTRKQPD